MHIKTKYTLILTDSQGNDYTVGSCVDEDSLEKMIAEAKASKPLYNTSYEVTKETTIINTETVAEFEVKAVDPTIDSVIAEAISYSEGQRGFYYPDSFEHLTEEEQAIVIDELNLALDYCDNCGHLVDAGELSEDSLGARVCDSCYSEEEEENDD